jgi:O-methyltransferase
VATKSTQTTRRGLRNRLRRGVNLAPGDGALRARLNKGLARANLELVVRAPNEVPEPEFERMLGQCEAFTMTSRERMYSVYQATRYVVDAHIPGDFVECGVWRGGSAMMAALTLLAHGDSHRRMWLYDTFQGMPKPSAEDTGRDGEEPHAEWKRNQRGDINEWCYSPLDDVRANTASTGLGADRLELVQGLVEETIPARAPEQIAMLRLDTDWYGSTRHELEHLFPRVAPGGVLPQHPRRVRC